MVSLSKAPNEIGLQAPSEGQRLSSACENLGSGYQGTHGHRWAFLTQLPLLPFPWLAWVIGGSEGQFQHDRDPGVQDPNCHLLSVRAVWSIQWHLCVTSVWELDRSPACSTYLLGHFSCHRIAEREGWKEHCPLERCTSTV